MAFSIGRFKNPQIISCFYFQNGYNYYMSLFYTRDGDDGRTGLIGKGRLPKHHPRIEALGTLDEASSALGLARALCLSLQTKTILKDVQRDLYALMGEVAAPYENRGTFNTLGLNHVQWLESQIDNISTIIPPLEQFILPGDSLSGAALALTRTIVRRSERRLSELVDAGEISNPILLQYLNRLSSLCFVLELLENQSDGIVTSLAKK
jgi:cob(I)alamin adenosyltransferase